MKKKIALIFGVSGQDGSYLADFLIKKNYSVIGVTRNKSKKNMYRLEKLKIFNKVKIIQGVVLDQKFLNKIIKKYSSIKEIYYLTGDSSATDSFIYPQKSFESNTTGILNILLTIKKINKKIKVFYAASGQFYGNSKNNYYSEKSVIKPTTPYAIAKAAGYWLVKIFRENYDLYACSGILFNHESPLRSDEFVKKKIINVSKQIKKNNKVKLRMGNIDVYRDWGWAPEYVKAMWLMLQQKQPIDLIIGSGKKFSVRDFVNEVFKKMKIDKKNLITGTNKLIRKIDVQSYRANTALCKKKIKWETKITFKRIIHKMINDELY
jgi:GDPmannose 4,6-dehydratase